MDRNLNTSVVLSVNKTQVIKFHIMLKEETLSENACKPTWLNMAGGQTGPFLG